MQKKFEIEQVRKLISPKLHFLKVQNLHNNLDDKSPSERLTEQSFIERRKLQKNK